MSTAQPVIEQPPVTTEQPVAGAVETRILGILSLVFGAASIVAGSTFIVPIAAIVLGILGLKREPASRTFSIWGIVLGGVMLVLPLLAVALGLAFLIPVGLFAGFGGF
ncbi:hypothetical protein [Glaciihabitans sp. UYNi722]|uniref:hypothetical protein n=1 Tax=Glaciihabitans sp. UYNi722 TaxID=3156344 RepID=UPI003393B556